VKDPRLIDERKIDLRKREAGVRAGLPGKGELALAPRVQRDEGQRCEHIGRGDHAARFDARAPQRFEQEPPKGIVPHFAEHRGLCAVLCQRREKVCRSAAGMRRHGRIAVFVGRKARKVDQQLAQRSNVKHGFPLTFAVCAAAVLYGLLPDAANGADDPVLCPLPDHRAAAQQTEQERSSKRHPIPHLFLCGIYAFHYIFCARAWQERFPFPLHA